MNYENFKIIDRANFKAGEFKNYGLFLHKQNKSLIMRFESAADLVECVDTNVKNGYWRYHNSSSSDSWIYGREGYDTFQLNREAILQGRILQQHIDLIDRYKQEIYSKRPELKDLEHQAQLKKRRRRFNEDDGELDIDRYMSGDPAMFVKTTPTLQKGNVCKMHFDQATSCGNGFKSFIEGMAWCIAMVDIIQTAGISVELTFGYTTQDCVQGVDFTNIHMVAKHAHEPVDVTKLMTYGLSGLFRKYVFAAWDMLHIGQGTSSSLGYAVSSFASMPTVGEFLDADILIKSNGVLNDGQITEVIKGVERFFKADYEAASTF